MYLMLLKNKPDFYISENFKSSEFLCKCNYSDCNHSFMYEKTIHSLQLMRTHIGKGLKITSAHRCQRHNSVVGGHKDSYHKKGHAVDFTSPKDMSLDELYTYATMFFDIAIKYNEKGFVHAHNL